MEIARSTCSRTSMFHSTKSNSSRGGTSRARMTRLLGNAFLIAVSLAAALVLTEVVLRIAVPQSEIQYGWGLEKEGLKPTRTAYQARLEEARGKEAAQSPSARRFPGREQGDISPGPSCHVPGAWRWRPLYRESRPAALRVKVKTLTSWFLPSGAEDGDYSWRSDSSAVFFLGSHTRSSGHNNDSSEAGHRRS